MRKTWLIFNREYFTRVRSKTFIFSTFLLPVVIVLFIAGSIVLAIKGKTRHRIAVIDSNHYFQDYLKSDSTILFDFSPGLDTLNYEQKGCTAVLIIPALREGHKSVIRLKYKKQLGLANIDELERRVYAAITDRLITEQTHISMQELDAIRNKSDLAELKTYEDSGKEGKVSSQGLAYAIGFTSGLLIYLLTLIYGGVVMSGVMEEKTNRIAEVIISSVKPFQLMLGKITGIGAVGLTQFLLWIGMIVGLLLIAQLFIPHEVWQEVQRLQQAGNLGNDSAVKASAAARRVYELQATLNTANWGFILLSFLFYFLGGYLFYSSLYAAVGSVVNENAQEANSLILPIIMPLIFSFIIMQIAIPDPGGSIAVWSSILPFSSPIVMMARIPYGVPGTVPFWQLGLSILMLIAGFLFNTWLAGKIYRTGILMYGKKPTWRQMWKWAFR